MTCLFKKNANDGRGTPYPPPLGCFARRAILIGHQHTVPSLLVVGSSIPSFMVVGCSIRASFTCLLKKNFERQEDTPSHTLPRLGVPLPPLFSAALDGCGLTTAPSHFKTDLRPWLYPSIERCHILKKLKVWTFLPDPLINASASPATCNDRYSYRGDRYLLDRSITFHFSTIYW